jgi:hypothetical protein
MYRSMLFLHWKQIRHALVLMIMASFGLPLLAVGGLGTPPGLDSASLEAYRFVAEFQTWLAAFPALAGLTGMALALSAWNWDHQVNHVYALSLPMTRWEYTLQKMLAGMTLALLPAAAMWLGAHLAIASISLPVGLQAYPNELAIRFLAAILVCYAALFAMAAGTVKTTLAVAGVFFGFVFFGAVANDVLAGYYAYFQRVHVVGAFIEWIFEGPGPFGVFAGSWTLIDV